MREQNKQLRRLDFFLALALVIGAVVFAAASLWLPKQFEAPMNAKMDGVVDDVAPGYENTRMTIRLEGNAVRYTMMIEDFEALTEKPEIGDEVILKFDITPDRYLRGITLVNDGAKNAVYQADNPVAVARERGQILLFVLYGIFAVIAVLVYRAKKQKL